MGGFMHRGYARGGERQYTTHAHTRQTYSELREEERDGIDTPAHTRHTYSHKPDLSPEVGGRVVYVVQACFFTACARVSRRRRKRGEKGREGGRERGGWAGGGQRGEIWRGK